MHVPRGLFLLFLSVACHQTSVAQIALSDSTRQRIITKTISERWELDPEHKRGTFRLMYYKPIYVTAGRWSSNPNTQPKSENPNYSLPEPEAYNSYEAKFQLSFKSKLIQSAFFGIGDLWIGYT